MQILEQFSAEVWINTMLLSLYFQPPLSLIFIYLFISLLVSSAYFLLRSQIFFPFWPSFQGSFYKSR